MIIKVTQEHIDKGKANSRCPIALAIISAGFIGVLVDEVYIYIDGCLREGKYSRFVTPIAVRMFIHKFDLLESVEPFEFNLDLYLNTILSHRVFLT